MGAAHEAALEEAIRRIRQVQNSGAASLSLEGLALQAIPEEVRDVSHITELALDKCSELTDLSGLQWCTSLRRLVLTRCPKLIDLEPLRRLRDSLRELQLGSHNLSRANILHRESPAALDLSPLETLSQLSVLGVKGCAGLDDLQPLSGLTALQQLDLSGCGALQHLQQLSELTALQHLDLSWCHQLRDLQALSGLTALQHLDLGSCYQLEHLQPLSGLTALQYLDLSWCHQLRDLQALSGLTALQHLDLNRCVQLQDLQPLSGLTALQHLNLWGCDQLQDLQALSELAALQHIDLGACGQLMDLQPLLGLKALRHLDLDNCNQLPDLSPLSTLGALESLELINSCALDCLPSAWLLPTSSTFKTLCVDRLISAPAELGSNEYGDNALPRIHAWQQDLLTGESASSTTKVFVLGNGTVGKTQISRRLRGDLFDPTVPSTHGIHQFLLRLADASEDLPAVDAQVWDFGGQDVYLGTHALFVDEHAIFVLCWSPVYENTNEFEQHGTLMRNRPLAYWLAYIRSLAGESAPVIVVQTRCDRELDVRAAPIDPDHGFVRLREACSSAKRTDGMELLQLELKRAARYQLERLGKVRLPQSWVDLVGELRSRHAEKMLPRADLDAICRTHGVRADPAVVLEYLHRSGQVFWHDGLFGNQIILDQSWALRGVYAILERKDVMPILCNLSGRFTPQLLAAIAWPSDNEQERRHFLSLMRQCQICFNVADDTYVAPALLPTMAQVESQIRNEWRHATADSIARLDYAFLHEGVLRAMLCELGSRAGERAIYWAYGVCFYDQRHQSMVSISSALPDVGTGQGGWIRIEAGGGEAVQMVRHLVDSILRVSIGRQPEVSWERGDGEAVRANLEKQEIAPFAAVQPGYSPALADEARRIYVSYAWEDESSAWVDEIGQRLPASLQLIRDKNKMRPGDWISGFMREIGQAQLAIVVLSAKYLRSRYCMREFMHLHNRSLGERDDLMQRVVPLVVGDLRISDAIDRLDHVKHWKQRHDTLDSALAEIGIASADNAAREELLLMKDFQHRTGDLLAWMDDVLIPRGQPFSDQNIDAVIQVLQERAGLAAE